MYSMVLNRIVLLGLCKDLGMVCTVLVSVFIDILYSTVLLGARYDGMVLDRLVLTGVVVCVLPHSATKK